MLLINNKTLILIVLTTIIILVGFGFSKNVLATYYTSGYFISTNLLQGVSPPPTSIDSFVYNLSAKPVNTTATIGFNQDGGNTWYKADGTVGTETLVTGSNQTITFTSGWSGANFYYRVDFTSDGVGTPVLDDITLNYTVNTAPTVDSVSLNGGINITLTENTTTLVSATGTVSDVGGYTDISQVQGKLYRSGVGSGCSIDTDNCYEDSSCATSSCSGNSCNYTCDFNVQFYAEPTDSGPYSGQNWVAWVKVVDTNNASSTATSPGVELNTLQSLDVSPSINYGSVSPGSNSTGDHTATVTNTGNVAIDVQISGTVMTCSIRGSIPVGNQEYATSSFSYGAGTDLSTTPTDWNLDLPKPDSSNPTITDDTYWQVGVPTGIEGTCSGTNTFEVRSAL